MENVLFTHYAMIVKNLRGVLLLKSIDKKVINRIKWIINRFKYRNIGIPPVYYSLKNSNYFNKKVFRKLYYPIDEIVFLKNKFIEYGFDELFIEPIVMSSIYISPLLLLSNEYVDLVEKYSIGKISICRELGVSDWKLHMRISDYSILDFYEKMISLGITYVKNIRDPETRYKTINERKEVVEKDYKRYWRISCSSKYIYQYYLDPLLIINENPDYYKIFINEKHASALSVIPVINLTLID